MLFEEIASAGTKTIFQLRRDSDQVTYVRRREIGDEVTAERFRDLPCRRPDHFHELYGR